MACKLRLGRAMRYLMRRIVVVSLLFVFAFAVNCIAEQEPSGFHISRTTPDTISLYDSTNRLYVDYGERFIPDAEVSLISENEEVLKLAQDGRMIPLKEGKTTVTASVLDPEQGLLADSMEITVLDIQVQTANSTVDVLPGETAVLRAYAIPAIDRTLQYDWYRINPETDEDIWLASTKENFLILENVTDAMAVYCEISDGTHPEGLRVYSYIRLVNLEMAYPGGAAFFDGDIHADQDGNATLEVKVIARNPENLSYSWESPYGNELEGSSNSNRLEVTGITATTEYCCYITDEYGNWETVIFHVYPYDFNGEEEEPDFVGDPVIRFE